MAARRPSPRTTGADPTPTPRPGLVSSVYERLRQSIVAGQLPPGTRVSERLVADRLVLSRTPVRSALHRLEQEGFIAAVGSGRERRLAVAALTVADGAEVFTIVGHLEGLAARAAAQLPEQRRAALVADLRTVNAKLAKQARSRGNATRFFDLDVEFHRLFVEAVAGPRLLALYRAIKPQSERYIRLYVSVLLDQIRTSVGEHERIADSIASGDADTAQAAAETNWRNASARLAMIISQLGERGSWQL